MGDALDQLYRRGFRRLALNGGGRLNGVFLRAGWVDELLVAWEPLLGEGESTPAIYDAVELASPTGMIALERLSVGPGPDRTGPGGSVWEVSRGPAPALGRVSRVGGSALAAGPGTPAAAGAHGPAQEPRPAHGHAGGGAGEGKSRHVLVPFPAVGQVGPGRRGRGWAGTRAALAGHGRGHHVVTRPGGRGDGCPAGADAIPGRVASGAPVGLGRPAAHGADCGNRRLPWSMGPCP